MAGTASAALGDRHRRRAHGRRRRAGWLLFLATLATAGLPGAAAAGPAGEAPAPYPRPGSTRLAVAGADGGPLDGRAYHGTVSADGSAMAFTTDAPSLTFGAASAVYVQDLRSGANELVSALPSGQPLRGLNSSPGISADGRHVVFLTTDPLVSPQHRLLVVVKDRQTGALDVVSVGEDGRHGASGTGLSISADGSRVAFCSPDDLVSRPHWDGFNLYVRDRTAGRTFLVPVAADGGAADGESCFGRLSGDGRFVAFWSLASNLVASDENRADDVFLRDLDGETTQLVSVSGDGVQANATSYLPDLSADGRYVSFLSYGSNLVPDDTNPLHDVFVRDVVGGRTERVTVGSDGTEADFSSFSPRISSTGRYVTYTSQARNLVAGDTNGVQDTFVHDRLLGETERVSVSSGGEQHDGTFSGEASVSDDGRFVAFSTDARNLVPGMSGSQLYLRDRGPQVGVAGVHVVRADTADRVRGRVTFTGAALADVADPGDDAEGALGQARALGGELVGASLVYRAERADLLLRWRVATMPTVAAPPLAGTGNLVSLGLVPSVGGTVPGLVYEWSLTVDSQRWLVRGERVGTALAAAGPHAFSLHRCTDTCAPVAPLAGRVGTAGAEARVVVPLALLAAAEGDTLAAGAASAGVSVGPASTTLDTVAIPAGRLPERSVTVLTAGEAVSAEAGGGLLDVPVPAAEPWPPPAVRVCLGLVCSTTTT